MLRAQSLPLAKTMALPDHYDFDSWNANDYAAYNVICTEKDAIKLWTKQADALAVPLLLIPQTAFMRALDVKLAVLLAHPI